LEFRILGPLEVVDAGRKLALGGGRQRALLSVLLTRPNQIVSTDRLIDELWGEEAPKAAANTVQYYVSRLRKLLGTERIETRSPGYALRVEPGELDLEEFERLVRRADAESLRSALALWRGTPLADLAYERFARAEIGRLEELRVAALEKRIDADLELGQHSELVGELQALVGEHPLQERFRAQLMLALYRAGRQAEALAAYRDARAALVDGLGLEPGAALQELERAILRQDPSLQAPRRGGVERGKRAILVLPSAAEALDPLLSLAEPLARRSARELIVAALLRADEDVGAATTALAKRRQELAESGVEVRVVAYRSKAAGDDAVLLATEQDVDLLLLDIPQGQELPAEAHAVLRSAPCDVGLLVGESLVAEGRPVVVPFGGAEHDWAAVEVAAWLARSLGAPLRLLGTEDSGARRDASRLLGRASLVIQAAIGIVAEPVLVPPGAAGVLTAAGDAAALVMGLSDRWRSEGIGEARRRVASATSVPTLLVRQGLRPSGLAPPETMTRFTWTLASG
jgi:DNA-binding SARP family transcriptional activator